MRVRLYQIHELDHSNDEAIEQTFVNTAHNIDKKGTTKTRQIISVYSARNECIILLSLVKKYRIHQGEFSFSLLGSWALALTLRALDKKSLSIAASLSKEKHMPVLFN